MNKEELIKFWTSSAPDRDPGFFWRILQHCKTWHFSTIWLISLDSVIGSSSKFYHKCNLEQENPDPAQILHGGGTRSLAALVRIVLFELKTRLDQSRRYKHVLYTVPSYCNRSPQRLQQLLQRKVEPCIRRKSTLIDVISRSDQPSLSSSKLIIARWRPSWITKSIFLD